jgi:hypothetical protein
LKLQYDIFKSLPELYIKFGSEAVGAGTEAGAECGCDSVSGSTKMVRLELSNTDTNIIKKDVQLTV